MFSVCLVAFLSLISPITAFCVRLIFSSNIWLPLVYILQIFSLWFPWGLPMTSKSYHLKLQPSNLDGHQHSHTNIPVQPHLPTPLRRKGSWGSGPSCPALCLKDPSLTGTFLMGRRCNKVVWMVASPSLASLLTCCWQLVQATQTCVACWLGRPSPVLWPCVLWVWWPAFSGSRNVYRPSCFWWTSCWFLVRRSSV